MKQKDSNSKWIIEAFIITFILSGIISYLLKYNIPIMIQIIFITKQIHVPVISWYAVLK